jgi:hypothetical protein
LGHRDKPQKPCSLSFSSLPFQQLPTFVSRAEMNLNTSSASPKPEGQASTHTLRSSLQYQSLDGYVPRPVQLLKAFNNAYNPFKQGLPIPKAALDSLAKFTLSSDEYYALVTRRELERGRFIFLDEGKIIFDHATLSPHGEVIGEVMCQVSIQDRPHRLFISGTATGMFFLGFC